MIDFWQKNAFFSLISQNFKKNFISLHADLALSLSDTLQKSEAPFFILTKMEPKNTLFCNLCKSNNKNAQTHE